jgi:predicted dehydrogenase
MKIYQVGIIGYGGFGKFLHHWWNTLENVKVTAVSDAGLEEKTSSKLKTYKDWQQLLLNSEIDIVSIATPPAFHVEIACAAMRAGKHVLLEKPIALDDQGADQILLTQKETGKVIMVDHMLRYNPIIKSLIQLSKAQTFGKLRHAVVSNYAQDESLPAKHWFWDKNLSGGIFIEHGVHFFDIINALTDQRLDKVYGVAYNRNETQQDQVSAMVLYDQGLIASHYHSFSGPGFFEETTIRLMYDLAKIEITGWIPMSGTVRFLANSQTMEKVNQLPGWQIDHEEQIAELADVSRPEGWGNTAAKGSTDFKSGGITYDVSQLISGRFEIKQTKSEVYGECLQNILTDLITKIENPDHQPSITAEQAYESLKIAVLADQSSSK